MYACSKYVTSNLLTEERILRADTRIVYVFLNINPLLMFLDLSLYLTSKVGSAGCSVSAVGVNVKENSYVRSKYTLFIYIRMIK